MIFIKVGSTNVSNAAIVAISRTRVVELSLLRVLIRAIGIALYLFKRRNFMNLTLNADLCSSAFYMQTTKLRILTCIDKSVFMPSH